VLELLQGHCLDGLCWRFVVAVDLPYHSLLRCQLWLFRLLLL